MDWNNLSSGLIGAIIGSIIGAFATYKAAIKGAQISIAQTAKLDSERREHQEKDLKEQILSFVNEELESNLLLCEKIQISYAKVRFSFDAFDLAKRNAKILPKELIKSIQPVYTEIVRFNVLADYEQDKISYGHGYLDNDLIKQGEIIKSKIEETKINLLKIF